MRGYLDDQLLLRWYDSWHNTCSQAAFDVAASIGSIEWHPDGIHDSSTWDDVNWDAPLMQTGEVQSKAEAPNL